MKADNIKALREAIDDFSRAEAEYDNYVKSIPENDPDAEDMTIQLMGLIITYGEILVDTIQFVLADETDIQPA